MTLYSHDIVSCLLQDGIRGCIFDIDGTLIDSMPIWDELGARYLRSLGKEPEDNLGEILFPMTIAQGVTYLNNTYALLQSEEEIRSGLRRITEQFYREEVPLKVGAKELLSALMEAGIPMVLATIGETDLETAALQRLGVWDYFKGMYVCEDYHTTKQDFRIYEICADALQTTPKETLVVEDLLQALSSAKRAGFRTAAVYDAASEKDIAAIRRVSDYYFQDFKSMEVFS